MGAVEPEAELSTNINVVPRPSGFLILLADVSTQQWPKKRGKNSLFFSPVLISRMHTSLKVLWLSHICNLLGDDVDGNGVVTFVRHSLYQIKH